MELLCIIESYDLNIDNDMMLELDLCGEVYYNVGQSDFLLLEMSIFIVEI